MCTTPARCALAFINILFWLSGLAITICGCLLLWAKPLMKNFVQLLINKFGSKMTDQLKSHVDEIVEAVMRMSHQVGLVVLIAGIIILVISFMGCCGACCNNKCFLITYASIISVIAIAHISILIIWFAKKDLPMGLINKALHQLVYKYQSVSSGTRESLTLVIVMRSLACCGFQNGSDFDKSHSFEHHDVIQGQYYTQLQYPMPCCKIVGDPNIHFTDDCPIKFTPNNSYIETGCKEKVETVILPKLNLIAYISIGVLIFEIFIIIVALAGAKV